MTDLFGPGFGSLYIQVPLFIACAGVIGLVGTRMTGLADRLADRTGLGEAFMGGVFLGASTSLAGITASVIAAWDGHAALSLSNALGGIAAQTAFLGIADLAYRRANLEHAAASVPNMMQGALLISLLSLLLLGMALPNAGLGGIHLITPLLLVGYGLGLRLVYRSRRRPMWEPRMTRSTRVDTPDEPPAHARSLHRLWLAFALSAAVVISAGAVLTRAAESIIAETAVSAGLMGGLFIAVSTSLPELVTSIAAVRRGALTLAVGGILGGNAFDTLFAAVADIAYRGGPIYAGVGSREMMLVSLTILMTAVLLLGLLWRERRGIANIGFESALVLGIYIAGMILLSAPG